MKHLILAMLALSVVSCAHAGNRSIMANETNGALVWPHAADFKATNDIASQAAVLASNAVQDAAMNASNAAARVYADLAASNAAVNATNYTDGVATGLTALIASTAIGTATNGSNFAVSVAGAYVPTNDAAYLASATNFTASMGTWSNMGGRTWRYYPAAGSTSDASTVQADLDAHKTNAEAHAAQWSAATNGWEVGSHAGLATTGALTAATSGMLTGVTVNGIAFTVVDGVATGAITAGTSTNFAEAQEFIAVSNLAETALQTEADPLSLHTDGVNYMNGHLVIANNKGIRLGTNSTQASLSANQGDDYTGGGGHIGLLSASLGGAVQIIAYDPTGAVRRIEFYIGSNMNDTAATIEADGFHGNGSGITGITPAQIIAAGGRTNDPTLSTLGGVTNSAAGIAAAGGLTNIAVFRTPTALYSAPTVTVTKAEIDAWPMGEASMTLTSTVSLLNFSGLVTNDAGTWAISIIGTNGYTLDTNNLYGASTAVAAATNSATLPNEYLFRKVSGDIKPFVRITSR